MERQKLKMLFLYTGDPCMNQEDEGWSQMAEGWARHIRSNQIEVYSA